MRVFVCVCMCVCLCVYMNNIHLFIPLCINEQIRSCRCTDSHTSANNIAVCIF